MTGTHSRRMMISLQHGNTTATWQRTGDKMHTKSYLWNTTVMLKR